MYLYCIHTTYVLKSYKNIYMKFIRCVNHTSVDHSTGPGRSRRPPHSSPPPPSSSPRLPPSSPPCLPGSTPGKRGIYCPFCLLPLQENNSGASEIV